MLSIIVTGSRVLAVAVGMVLLARALGPTGFGEFTYALTLASVLAVIPDYGFDLQIVKRVAAQPAQAYPIWRSALRAKVLLTVLAVLLAFAWFVSQRSVPDEVLVGVILFASAIALSFGRLNTFAFRGIDRFDLDAATAIGLNGVLILGVVLAIITRPGALSASVAFLAARLFFLILTTWLVLRVIQHSSTSTPETGARDLLKEGLPYGIHTAVAVMYVSTDTLILKHFAGPTGVGIYQAGVRLVLAAMFLPEVLTSGLFPSFSSAVARGSRREALELGSVMNRLMVLSGGVLAVGLILVPDTIRKLAFSSQYGDLDFLLPWFGLIILFRFVSATYGAVATAAGGQRTRMLVGVVALIVNVGVNLVLIPTYGLRGAILASVTTHALLTLGYALLCHRLMHTWLLDKRAILSGSVILLGIIAGIVLIRSERTDWRLFITITTIVAAAVVGIRAGEWRRVVADLAPSPVVDEDHA
jgi:O-antigen/teichoic acid export membrane protein